MDDNTKLMAVAISFLSNDGKFIYAKTGKMFSKVLSYQVKRTLDKKWNKQKKLE